MFKKLIGKIHLWLGLSVGLIVVFLGITGCMLAFQREIESVTHTYAYIKAEEKPFLKPSELGPIAQAQLPGKQLHSVTYGSNSESAQVAFYAFEPEAYYHIVYINPYSGEVLKVKNMDRDFFPHPDRWSFLPLASSPYRSADRCQRHLDIFDHDDHRSHTLVAAQQGCAQTALQHQMECPLAPREL